VQAERHLAVVVQPDPANLNPRYPSGRAASLRPLFRPGAAGRTGQREGNDRPLVVPIDRPDHRGCAQRAGRPRARDRRRELLGDPLANLSGVPGDLSDAFCRLATGGGHAERMLYTDDEEMRFNARRPIILNGITSLVSCSDLRDRAMIVMLPALSPEQRRTEREFWQAFEQEHPRLLGALCSGVSMALQRRGVVYPASLSRLADSAEWVEAAAPSFGWSEGRILSVFSAARESATLDALAEDPIAVALCEFGEETSLWEGTVGELLAELNRRAEDTTRHGRGWPQTARKLSAILERLRPELRQNRLVIQDKGRGNKGRILQISATGADE
jgi:hypothetical protein